MLLLIKGYLWVAHFHKMNFDNFPLNVCLTLAFDLKGKMEVGRKDKWKVILTVFGAANRLYLRTSVVFEGRPSPNIFNLACSPLLKSMVSLEEPLYFPWVMNVSKESPLCPIPNLISERSRGPISLSGDPLYIYKNTQNVLRRDYLEFHMTIWSR